MIADVTREHWITMPIARIEDLSDAVRGAGLEATQLSRDTLSGSLLFGEHDGILCSSGSLQGQVALRGPLSTDMITLGAGLRLMPGCWQWLTEAETGGVGIFNAADEHDSLYTPGSLYAAVTLTEERMEAEAFHQDLVLDRHILGGSGVHARRLAPEALEPVALKFDRLHAGRASETSGACLHLLSILVQHVARPPITLVRKSSSNHHALVVRRARAYIDEHLDEPIAVDAVAAAAFASRRTLFRAFADILDDTPHSYVRRLRLHRIRHDLASDTERACTIAMIANQWGMSDLGRMAGWYRELFGERPSETVARTHGSPARP